jgi:hypothetical protein
MVKVRTETPGWVRSTPLAGSAGLVEARTGCWVENWAPVGERSWTWSDCPLRVSVACWLLFE